MTERVLVTGGAGYIGSVVTAQLLDQGFEVVVCDNPCHGNRAAVPARAKLVVEDIGNRAALDRLLREHRVDAVMHFAAFIEAGASGDQGEDHRPETHLIPLVLDVALGKRVEIAIYGTDYPTADGTCIRDYIHVADLEAIVRSALEWRRAHPDGYPG